MQKLLNPFHAYKNRSIIQKISLTGVFLALVLLFQFLEKYMPFGETYLKLNFSLLFILPIFYFAGPLFGLFIIFFRLAIGPALGTFGYTSIGITSHLILMVSSLTTIGSMYVYSFIFQKMKRHNSKVIIISIFTVMSTSIFLTILNGFFFTPLFWWILGYSPTISYAHALHLYSNVRLMFFNIKHYWGGIFAVFLTGNIIKFGLIYFIYFPFSKILNIYLKR